MLVKSEMSKTNENNFQFQHFQHLQHRQHRQHAKFKHLWCLSSGHDVLWRVGSKCQLSILACLHYTEYHFTSSLMFFVFLYSLQTDCCRCYPPSWVHWKTMKNRKKKYSSSKTKTVIADYGLGQGFGTRMGAGICWNILGYFHVGTMWAPCGHHGMYLLHPFKSLTFLVEDRGPVSPPREPDKSSENKANLRFLYVSFSAN